MITVLIVFQLDEAFFSEQELKFDLVAVNVMEFMNSL